MQRTHFGEMACSIARTLDVVGEPWSPLILRDVWVGISRFDDIRADLGISSKVLAERLRWLTEQGVLERRQYSERPPRHEYVLTDKGFDLCGVLMAMTAWGDRLHGRARPARRCCCAIATAARSRPPSCAAPAVGSCWTPRIWRTSPDPAPDR